MMRRASPAVDPRSSPSLNTIQNGLHRGLRSATTWNSPGRFLIYKPRREVLNLGMKNCTVVQDLHITWILYPGVTFCNWVLSFECTCVKSFVAGCEDVYLVYLFVLQMKKAFAMRCSNCMRHCFSKTIDKWLVIAPGKCIIYVMQSWLTYPGICSRMEFHTWVQKFILG
jgi:hypothetical protein